tara:strand:+ start:226 stop:1290 length:1065 start_codon:yes stop_codon:yes gene_type:complete
MSTFFFIWGLGIGVYKWFPYSNLQNAKQIFNLNKKKNNIKDISIDEEFINKYIKTIHKESLLPKREELIEKIIINNNLINVINETINDKSEKITTKIYDNKINAILTYASEQKNCLRIYIQGHGGNPFSYSYHNKLLKFFVSEGCDFLSMSMTGLGINEGSFSYPSRYGFISLDKEMAKNHKNYSFFYDEDNPKLDPLTLFISPHYKIIKSLTPNYENISIMGISGGGWYSVWLSALIPKIKFSVSYAGSLPMEYRKFEGISGDWEQQDSQIYNYVSYWELYKLMTLNEKGKINRQAILVFNDEDNCCFFNPYAQHFKLKIDKLNWKNFKVIIDENDKHIMNVNLVKEIFKLNK